MHCEVSPWKAIADGVGSPLRTPQESLKKKREEADRMRAELQASLPPPPQLSAPTGSNGAGRCARM